MDDKVRVLAGFSPHYHQLQTGRIKYQKSRPADPIWRIVVVDELANRICMRFFPCAQPAQDVQGMIVGILSAENLLARGVVIPGALEALCPGLQDRLHAMDVDVYIPYHGFGAGARVGRAAEDFLASLGFSLDGVGEQMASCEEIALISGHPLGFVCTRLWRDSAREGGRFSFAYSMANAIARHRGHDPEVGREKRDQEIMAIGRQALLRRAGGDSAQGFPQPI